MPALPSVPQVIRVVLKQFLNENTDIINRFFLQYTGSAPTAAIMTALAANLSANYGSRLAPKFGAGLNLTNIEVEDLTSPTSAVGSIATTIPGTDTGITYAAGTAFILQFKIDRRYRGGHPRMYLAGVTTGHLDDDQRWNTTYAASVAEAWENFINDIITAPPAGLTLVEQCNVSYYSGFHNFTFPSGRTRPIPTLRGSPLVDKVTDTTYNPRPGSQRRRNLQGS